MRLFFSAILLSLAIPFTSLRAGELPSPRAKRPPLPQGEDKVRETVAL